MGTTVFEIGTGKKFEKRFAREGGFSVKRIREEVGPYEANVDELWYQVGGVKGVELTGINKDVEFLVIVHDRLFVEQERVYLGSDGKWYIKAEDFERHV